jgi:hypothetical protein
LAVDAVRDVERIGANPTRSDYLSRSFGINAEYSNPIAYPF